MQMERYALSQFSIFMPITEQRSVIVAAISPGNFKKEIAPENNGHFELRYLSRKVGQFALTNYVGSLKEISLS